MFNQLHNETPVSLSKRGGNFVKIILRDGPGGINRVRLLSDTEELFLCWIVEAWLLKGDGYGISSLCCRWRNIDGGVRVEPIEVRFWRWQAHQPAVFEQIIFCLARRI